MTTTTNITTTIKENAMFDSFKPISELLFSSPCKENGVCRNLNCKTAVAEFTETGRWYILFAHAGFNSPANNTNGYASEAKALASIRRYLKK